MSGNLLPTRVDRNDGHIYHLPTFNRPLNPHFNVFHPGIISASMHRHKIPRIIPTEPQRISPEMPSVVLPTIDTEGVFRLDPRTSPRPARGLDRTICLRARTKVAIITEQSDHPSRPNLTHPNIITFEHLPSILTITTPLSPQRKIRIEFDLIFELFRKLHIIFDIENIAFPLSLHPVRIDFLLSGQAHHRGAGLGGVQDLLKDLSAPVDDDRCGGSTRPSLPGPALTASEAVRPGTARPEPVRSGPDPANSASTGR